MKSPMLSADMEAFVSKRNWREGALRLPAANDLGMRDPGIIVWDEIVGFLFAMRFASGSLGDAEVDRLTVER